MDDCVSGFFGLYIVAFIAVVICIRRVEIGTSKELEPGFTQLSSDLMILVKAVNDADSS